MIKNIIFDLAGVFITTEEKKSIKYFSKKLNIPEDKLSGAYYKYSNDYESNKLSQEEFTNSIFKELNMVPPKDFWQLRLSFKHRHEEMFNFLNILKQSYNCYFISNEGKEYWKDIDKKLKVSENFIDGVLSNEAKVRKPDTKIFKMLIERNQLNPNETLFIDDSEKNLQGAKDLGMKTIH